MKILKTIFACALIVVFFTATAYAQTATLTWAPNSESDLAGYEVFVGGASGEYNAPIDVNDPLATQFNVSGLVLPCGNFVTWFFAIKAYDLAGNRSGLSNEVSKVFDVAPCNPTMEEIVAAVKSLLQNAKIVFPE